MSQEEHQEDILSLKARLSPYFINMVKIVQAKPSIFFLGILLVLTIVSYANVIDGEFQFDDYMVITDNLYIKNIENFMNPGGLIGMIGGERYITDFTFAINYYYNQLSPRGYHFFSVILHFCVACLVFLLARRIFLFDTSFHENSNNYFAFLAAAIFALHPVNTGAVSYISQRAEILCTFFYLVALLFYIKAGEHTGRIAKISLYTAGLSQYLLSLGSKLSAVSFPGTLFLYDFLTPKRKGFLKRLPPYLITAVLTGVIGFLFLSSQRIARDIGYSLGRIDFKTYLYTEFRVVLTYIRLLFLPVNQNFDYEFRLSSSILEWDTLLSLLTIIALIIYAFLLRRRSPIVAFGILWFFLTLMPTSSFVPVVDVIFEHRVYMPSIGFALVAAFCILKGIDLLKGSMILKSSWNVAAGTVTLLLLAGMTYATIERNRVWESKMSLWSDVVKKSPGKPRVYMNYGQALSERGYYGESIAVLKRGLECKDDGTMIRVGLYRELGVSFYRIGMLDDAITAYQNGLRYAPYEPTLLNNLSVALLDKGQIEQAKMYAEIAIKKNPAYADIYYTIGNIHFRMREYQDALAYFLQALKLNPDEPLGYWNVGLTMETLGDYQSAYYYFSKLVEMSRDTSQREQGLLRLKRLEEQIRAKPPSTSK